jgi:hypothetical protein
MAMNQQYTLNREHTSMFKHQEYGHAPAVVYLEQRTYTIMFKHQECGHAPAVEYLEQRTHTIMFKHQEYGYAPAVEYLQFNSTHTDNHVQTRPLTLALELHEH